MPKGGRRSGAGRPKGSRDGAPRRQRVQPLPAPEVAAILDYARSQAQDGSLVRVLEEFKTSADPEHRKWWAQVVASYGVGLPGKRPDSVPPDLAKVMKDARIKAQELIRERRELPPPRVEAADSLISEGARLISDGQPQPAPLTPEIVAPEPVQARTPERAEKGSDGWPKATMELTVFRVTRE